MHRALLVVVLAGCGDNHSPNAEVPDAGNEDILVLLDGLPGVTATEVVPDFDLPGYRYFDVYFTQPIDHDHPELGTFQQYAAIMHNDAANPLVLQVGGYEASWTQFLTEPAQLLGANQISLEYRFYGQSKPTGDVDWTKLTVAQAMADEHAIIGLLATIYGGARIQTGGSKGGENAMAHAFTYPDDLAGVVAYVAPVITANPDVRYDGILDRVGIPECRTRLREVAREMLVRRGALEAMVELDGETYARPGLDHAFETAVVELEFSFWMTRGESDCGVVPSAAATDLVLYTFLVDTGGPASYGDAELERSGQQYIFQDQAELGYPIWNHAYLDDLLIYSYEDWTAYMPTTAQHPTYAPAEPVGLAAYLETSPLHIMHIGGEWDPWGAGYPTIATSGESLDFRVAHGSHWSSGIYSLEPSDQQAAVAALQRWAGVTAMPPMRATRAPLRELDPARVLGR